MTYNKHTRVHTTLYILIFPRNNDRRVNFPSLSYLALLCFYSSSQPVSRGRIHTKNKGHMRSASDQEDQV